MNPTMMPTTGMHGGSGASSNNMMDMFRSQLMTMTMFSSMNSNNGNNGKYSGNGTHNSGSGSSASNAMTDSLYGMLYVFLITQF